MHLGQKLQLRLNFTSLQSCSATSAYFGTRTALGAASVRLLFLCSTGKLPITWNNCSSPFHELILILNALLLREKEKSGRSFVAMLRFNCICSWSMCLFVAMGLIYVRMLWLLKGPKPVRMRLSPNLQTNIIYLYSAHLRYVLFFIPKHVLCCTLTAITTLSATSHPCSWSSRVLVWFAQLTSVLLAAFICLLCTWQH